MMNRLPSRHHPPKPDPSNSQKRRRRRRQGSAVGSLAHLPARRTLRCTPPSFLLLAAIILSFLNLVSCSPNCLRFATYSSINQLFIDGGPGTKVLLCPSKTYRLSGTIVFTAADQELATSGYPTGSERAILRIAGDASTAIQGDCRRCARVGMRSLIIDGNRSKLGRVVDPDLATGLIVLGGNEGQTIADCWIKDPRGFTAIHIREGDRLSCTGAVIEKNEIGPVGDEYDPELDGPDPEMSPKGRPLADGISIACRDSFVRDNTFHDNTDAAIVVYCSPGTLIQANHIIANKLSAMAGILLVDSTPFDGDYTGTTIKDNIIDAASRIIRVGIGVGATVWSDDTDTILHGGSVLANGFKGNYMGFGIAAAGLNGWTIKDNWDEAGHQGERSARCFDIPVNPDPVGYLQWSEKITNTALQPGFIDQEFQYLVCLDEPEDDPTPMKDDTPALPPQVKSAAAIPTSIDMELSVSTTEGFSTGSEVMDDILEHSLQRMLEAIDRLARRVDVLATTGRHVSPASMRDGVSQLTPEISNAFLGLNSRIEALEIRQRLLVDTALNMRSAMKAWDQEMASMNEWQYDVLLDVQYRLGLYLSPPENSGKRVKDRSRIAALSERARILSGGSGTSDASSGIWATILRFVLAQGLFGMVVVGVRRCLKRRDHSKIL